MKVKELLSDESKWCQGPIARSLSGRSVSYNNPNAVCWCLWGALHKCYPDENQFLTVRRKVKRYIRGDFVTDWNEDRRRTFAEVKALVEELDI